MGALQPWHLIIILAVVLIIFGAGKLSDVGGALGKSVKEFKENVKEGEEAAPPPLAATRSGATSGPAAPAAPATRQSDLPASRPDDL